MTPDDPRLARIDAIAIGTSAGGVEALSVLLPALRRGHRAAVFVVLHVPRQRPSLLVDVFQPKCEVIVSEAVDKEPVLPGRVYFAPPDYHMLIDGPLIAMSADPPVNFSRPSIDVLFESAADEYRDRLLGIILTGASHDGAAGLARIRDAGGLTIVQEPLEALVPTMSEGALERTSAHARLTLAQIARLLHGL